MNQEQNNNNNNELINDNEDFFEEKSSKKVNIWVIIGIVIAVIFLSLYVVFYILDSKSEKTLEKTLEKNEEVKEYSYHISSNSLEDFDLYFLKIENEKQNKIYSPLSIKYALEMLEEGAVGESKTQISNVIGEYEAKKYINSKNMSFANSIFIKDTYQNSIKTDYMNTLMEKYNAEVKIDSFTTPNNVNSWVNDKTLGLINNLFNDISSNNFLLINALGIDMEWEQKFLLRPGIGIGVQYQHEKFSWFGGKNVEEGTFDNNNQSISGMKIIASFNNYDIVNDIGEESIRQTVKEAYLEYLKDYPNEEYGYGLYFAGKDDSLSGTELMEQYLDVYIEEINSNYKKEDKTTDFSLYVDDRVKAFAKDLKEYDRTTLQYVAIMPINENLDSYINNVTAKDINTIIGNLKELKASNFKDGVVTKITGFIPKFKFEYSLDLKNDLKKLGITNVFESGKANLMNISNYNSLFINDAVHKANIEFTQDGIKAAAVTSMGGAGAAGGFDYWFDIPVEEIDLTFDKPYVFIIRDKNTGEVWFTGTVYNPLSYTEDATKGWN